MRRSFILLVLVIAGCGKPGWWETKEIGGIPFQTPYPVENYPMYEGSLGDLVPEHVAEFTRTESKEVLSIRGSLHAWSAFFKSKDGAEIHVRIMSYSTPTYAYNGFASDCFAGVAVHDWKVDPVVKNHRVIGTRAYGQYKNGLTNGDADCVAWTHGTLVFAISSKDGVHAESFRREFEKGIGY